MHWSIFSPHLLPLSFSSLFFALPFLRFCSLSLSLLSHILPLPHLIPIFQFLCVLAHCSASSQPPRSWRWSINQGPGVKTPCKLVTGCMSCRGHPIEQRCCMSTPLGMTIGKTESPQPISECFVYCVYCWDSWWIFSYSRVCFVYCFLRNCKVTD